MEIIFLGKIMIGQNKNFKHKNSSHIHRDLKKLGKKNCNLCKKEFDTYSKFDRFCLACKHSSEIYRGYFL
jgi:hypothetical protein